VNKRKAILRVTIAALAVLGAAICVAAQTGVGPVKQNTRELKTTKEETKTDKQSAPVDDASYSYEFQKSDFHIRHIVIKHDARGQGEISFERQGDLEPIIEPIAFSDAALARVLALWDALRFLDSTTNYQADKDFAHLGTMRLWMKRAARERTAEFNWTNDPNAKALADEYRRAANQAVFIFDMSVARQNQPLDSPKLLDRLDNHLKRGDLSDPRQLIPLLREVNMDERLPLMARNHAARILKQLEK
jgi:hypothetical protein